MRQYLLIFKTACASSDKLLISYRCFLNKKGQSRTDKSLQSGFYTSISVSLCFTQQRKTGEGGQARVGVTVKWEIM